MGVSSPPGGNQRTLLRELGFGEVEPGWGVVGATLVVARVRVGDGVGLTNTGDHKSRPYEDTEFQHRERATTRVAPTGQGRAS